MEGRPLDESDARLIERARCGDIVAFEAIVRRYQDLAFRVAYAIVGSAEEAEDVAQEGFLRAYRALHQFRSGAPLRPWLVTIVANAARSQRSSALRRASFTIDADTEIGADDASSPEAAALDAETSQELMTAVSALRDEDRRVIASRFFLGLSETETAAVLGCARGTVKSRQSRALARLRAQLYTGSPFSSDEVAHA